MAKKQTPQICIMTVTGVRIIPVPRKKAGQIVHFGGPLGSAPVMKVAKIAAPEFIARRGRIPAPITALRN